MLITAEPSFLTRHRKLLLRLTTGWTASGVVLYLWLPRAVPALLLLSPIAPVAWHLATIGRLPWRKPSAVIWALLLAGAYLCFNLSWSLSPDDARVSLAMFLLLVAVLYVVSSTLAVADEDVLRVLSVGLYAGMVIGGFVLCCEVFSQQWIQRSLMSIVPALQPKPRDMILNNGWVIYLETYLINRNIAAVTFLLWPTALAVSLLAAGGRRHWWLAGLVPLVAAILAAKHGTSKVAFAGSALAFAAFHLSPTLTRRAITWSWTGAILLVAPLASLAFHGQLYLSQWIPHSAQHRLVIWGHTSSLIAKAPILGSGISTARALNDPTAHDAPLAPGSEFRLTTGLHSHNVYLQTWYETGAVGACLLLVIGLLVVRAVMFAPPQAQAYLYAAFVACALLGAASFSLWQPWFMASFGFTAIFALVGREFARRSGRQG